MANTLVIVPCGQGKIWDKMPEAGSVMARDAYTGSPFKVNREYAECFGDRWVILSAKYGFIDPDFELPGPYNITFKKKSPELITLDILQKQMQILKLDAFDQVIGLGGKEYRAMIQAVFEGRVSALHFPFAGLPIGKAMAAIKQRQKN